MKHHFDYYWHWCSLKYISETLPFCRLWKLFHVTWRGIQMNRDCITLVKRKNVLRNWNLDSRSVSNWSLSFTSFLSLFCFSSLSDFWFLRCLNMEEWRQSMFTLSVVQLIIQISVQRKQDLISVNNRVFSFCYYCLYLTFFLTDLHMKKSLIFFKSLSVSTVSTHISAS